MKEVFIGAKMAFGALRFIYWDGGSLNMVKPKENVRFPIHQRSVKYASETFVIGGIEHDQQQKADKN
jgi:hypothetical protein